jgi:hypothetical protein
VDGLRTETPMQRGAKMLRDSGYHADGGKVTMARVKKTVKRAVTEHEDEEHHGKHGVIRLKAGGAVKGKKPAHRPDRKARDAGGQLPMTGAMPPSPAAMQQAQAARTAQMSQAPAVGAPPQMPAAAQPPMGVAKDGGKVERKRADGGNLGMGMDSAPKPRRGGKSSGHKGGGPKTINVIVGKGDSGAEAQQAHQQGMQEGVQLGARAAAQKMAGAPVRPPMAGPPRPPMGAPPPGGMPPPGGGGMAGGPPMAGAPGAPRPPMPPQMARDGGHLRDEHGRFVGGSV